MVGSGLSMNTLDDAIELVLRRVFLAQGLLVAGLIALVLIGQFLSPEHLGSMPASILVGALGGSLSLLRRLRTGDHHGVVQMARSNPATYMPLVYGGLMAGVAYLLFMSGILTGEGGRGLFTSNLFPNFTFLPEAEGLRLSMREVVGLRPKGVQDLGKLLVWCFVSGYSESFVVGVLSTLERQRGGDANRPSDPPKKP